MTAYLWTALMWSVAGLCLGLLIGYLYCCRCGDTRKDTR